MSRLTAAIVGNGRSTEFLLRAVKAALAEARAGASHGLSSMPITCSA